jgi:hypothetical protein
MPSPSLHSRLTNLAQSFADDVLAAIRTVSLHELTGDGREGGNGRRTRVGSVGSVDGGGGEVPIAFPGPRTKGGRLARRSADDIQKTLGLVTAAIKASRGKGMRAEEIRSFLKIDKRELPRVLKEGLKTKKLRSKGQKRATAYFAT